VTDFNVTSLELLKEVDGQTPVAELVARLRDHAKRTDDFAMKASSRLLQQQLNSTGSVLRETARRLEQHDVVVAKGRQLGHSQAHTTWLWAQAHEAAFNAGFDAVGRAMKVRGWSAEHPDWVRDRRKAYEKFLESK